MLFKVLYTHQKLKKHKTWQDGFLEVQAIGRKAVLLSEEKKILDSLYTSADKIHAVAELESDKFLIQVEDEVVADRSSAVNQMSIPHSLPNNIQRVTVSRHGLTAKKNNRKAFRPPLMDKNAMVNRTQSNTYGPFSSSNEPTPSHPCLLKADSTLGNKTYKRRSDENFTQLYANCNSDQRENEENLFHMPATKNLHNNDHLDNDPNRDVITNMHYRNHKDTEMIQRINHRGPLINRSSAQSKPSFVEPERPTQQPPNSNKHVSNTKRSTSEIIALFSKKSRPCYRENINTDNTVKNQSLRKVEFNPGPFIEDSTKPLTVNRNEEYIPNRPSQIAEILSPLRENRNQGCSIDASYSFSCVPNVLSQNKTFNHSLINNHEVFQLGGLGQTGIQSEDSHSFEENKQPWSEDNLFNVSYDEFEEDVDFEAGFGVVGEVSSDTRNQHFPVANQHFPVANQQSPFRNQPFSVSGNFEASRFVAENITDSGDKCEEKFGHGDEFEKDFDSHSITNPSYKSYGEHDEAKTDEMPANEFAKRADFCNDRFDRKFDKDRDLRREINCENTNYQSYGGDDPSLIDNMHANEIVNRNDFFHGRFDKNDYLKRDSSPCSSENTNFKSYEGDNPTFINDISDFTANQFVNNAYSCNDQFQCESTKNNLQRNFDTCISANSDKLSLKRSASPSKTSLNCLSNYQTRRNLDDPIQMKERMLAGAKLKGNSNHFRPKREKLISPEQLIKTLKREANNPLSKSISDHPGSTFPYQGLSSCGTVEGLRNGNGNCLESGETIMSPVFNPRNCVDVPDVQQKSPFKNRSSLKGAVTSNVVRRSEFSQASQGTADCSRSEDSPWNKYMDDDPMPSTDNYTINNGNLYVGDCVNSSDELPTSSFMNKRKALTSCPTDAVHDAEASKMSSFGFVPTPSIDVQDDELTLYNEAEVYPNSNIREGTHAKPQQRHSKRVGLSKRNHAIAQGSNVTRSTIHSTNQCGDARIEGNASFKPTYASFAQEIGSGMRSMFGDLYFPSVEDVDGNPTPLRMVKIPIEFESLNEYKNTFRAALREHLNILLFDLAKNYHTALKRANICLDFETNTGTAANKRQNGPSCPHGDCKLRAVRKDGPNKGKMFFCCPGTAKSPCKFFMWAEEYQKKTGGSEKSKDAKTENKIILSDISSVSTFFSGQSVAFYCGCTLLKNSRGSFQTNIYRGRGSKWGKASRYKDDTDSGKKSLYLSLSFKGNSSTYGKDDLWIISKNFSFHPSSTFIAKSTFYGPTSSGELQITAASSYSPSNWESGETVHALLACNAGTELTCINNLEEITNISEIPVLPHLILRNITNQRPRLSSNSRFHCPALQVSMENDLLSRDVVISMCDDTIAQYDLNEDQSKALKSIACMFCTSNNDSSKESHVTLIHGVFGAGKSFLLAVVIVFLVNLFRKNQNEDENSEISRKILVSSTTNVAVDRVLQGLLDIGFDDFVRVGSLRKIAKPVLPFSVHATGSDDQELKELQGMLKSDLSPSEKSYVRKSIEKHRLGLNRKKLLEVPVVGVTCAACVFPCMAKLSFKIHLLDECSQMTEPLSLLPIARFKCERLILVGDPKQLSPTIQGSEADHQFGVELTLFDRLKQKGHTPIMLRTQYRCHPLISAVPNELFYKGQLKDGVTAEQRSPVISWLNTLCFYNVSKGRERCGNDGSYYNQEEAEFVVFLINAMLLFDIEPSKIGVITQYKSQVWKISSLLQEQSANPIGCEEIGEEFEITQQYNY